MKRILSLVALVALVTTFGGFSAASHISASQLSIHAATLGNSAMYPLATGAQNVLIVSPSGGNFTSVQAALNSITNNSSRNPYLIWVGPGKYFEQVTMKPWVDIEGAGEDVTRIYFGGSSSAQRGTVVGTNNAELRFLTIENTGAADNATAIYDAGSLSLLHVTAKASGGTSNNTGIFSDDTASTRMNNVTATASGGFACGIKTERTTAPTMNNVTAMASGGSYDYAIYNRSPYASITNVTATASGQNSGNLVYGVYNDNFGAPSGSLTMNNVVATASGPNYYNFGVDNLYSSPRMTNVVASASGGYQNYGIAAPHGSPIMNDIVATASGGTDNFALLLDAGSPVINNATATASGGSTSYGLYNTDVNNGFTTAMVNHSTITGSTNTVYNVGSFLKIGSSNLSGGPVFTSPPGGITCAGVYDENYTFYANTCP
jgi:hypothetical protein